MTALFAFQLMEMACEMSIIPWDQGRLDSSAYTTVAAHFPLALEATFIIFMGNRPMSHFIFHWIQIEFQCD